MGAPQNQAAWLIKAGEPLQVDDAPMPTPGPGEIVVKNAAVAMNPIDCSMLDSGVFVQRWPAVFGCDIAGIVFETGSDVSRFKKGDRVIGHAISLVTGKPQNGAFALYTAVPADKAAILPDGTSFTNGVVVPFALEAAVCALSLKEPGIAMPGVPTPALSLPYPSLENQSSSGKTLVIYGGSSSVGSMATQLAAAAGIHVIAIAGAHNSDLCKRCGADQVLDRNDPSLVDKVTDAVGKLESSGFVGIFDAISSPGSYALDLAILNNLGGGHLACTHPPPADVPGNVSAGMIFAVNDVATPVWQDYVTPALQTGKLECLPSPSIVGKGLSNIQIALERCKEGVSAAKLVVEL